MIFKPRDNPKPRVFLGSIVILPKDGLLEQIEGLVGIPSASELEYVENILREVFALPPVGRTDTHLEEDLGLDIYVTSFRLGIGIFTSWVPIIWRPKIALAARIYRIKSNKTLETVSVTQQPKWKEALGRLFSWQFGADENTGRVFRGKDTEPLVVRASEKLLRKIVEATH